MTDSSHQSQSIGVGHAALFLDEISALDMIYIIGGSRTRHLCLVLMQIDRCLHDCGSFSAGDAKNRGNAFFSVAMTARLQGRHISYAKWRAILRRRRVEVV